MSLLSIAIPLGALNFAEVPVPSVFPATPDPAIVVTFPVGVIFLMIWLPVSATYKLLLESIAIPVGLLNLAQVPKPSVFPVQLKQPANTETNPAGDICKMLDPEPLTTYKLLYVFIEVVVFIVQWYSTFEYCVARDYQSKQDRLEPWRLFFPSR